MNNETFYQKKLLKRPLAYNVLGFDLDIWEA